MPRKNRDPEKMADEPPESTFVAAVLNFSLSVLKLFQADIWRMAWALAVLVFIVLAFMTVFGSLTAEQRFILALATIAAVIVILALGNWKSREIVNPPSAAPDSSAASDAALVRQAQKCLSLLTEIGDANARVIARGRSAEGPWARLQREPYNHVCDVRRQRSRGTPPPEPYFDVICADPDVGTVCDRKWELGEALEDYRRWLDKMSPVPLAHDELELLIRRSVTQPDCTPAELATAVQYAIDNTKRLL